jgi:hypothetical protein
MKNIFRLKAVFLLAAVLVLPVTQAAIITQVELTMAQSRVSAALEADRHACESLTATAKDVCAEEVSAREVVARAELQYEFSGKPDDRTKVLEAKAKSAHAIAMKKCDGQAGRAKAVCVQEAEALEVKMLAEAKLDQQPGEAKQDSAQDILDADFKVAFEKCNAESGDVKARCKASTKSRFGKH